MEHGSIITQARREDALVLTKQGLVSKSSPKKPRGRSIFKALLCCFHTQHVVQSSSSTELTHKEEANTIAKVAAGWGVVHILAWASVVKVPGPGALNSLPLVVCLLLDTYHLWGWLSRHCRFHGSGKVPCRCGK